MEQIECLKCGKRCSLLAEVTKEDNIPVDLTTTPKNGRTCMKRNEEGICVALKNNQCSIYDKRPKVCRKYECWNEFWSRFKKEI